MANNTALQTPKNGRHAQPRKNTRERITRIAMDLFYEHGFHAVGLDRVIEQAGVTKTTFYYHFESKDDLILTAMSERDEASVQRWRDEVRQAAGGDPRRMLIGFVESLSVWFEDERFHGCVYTNAAAEFPSRYDPIHQLGAVHKHRIEAMLDEVAEDAGAAEPRALAQELMVIIEGALVWRHVAARPNAAAVALQLAHRTLAAHLPDP